MKEQKKRNVRIAPRFGRHWSSLRALPWPSPPRLTCVCPPYSSATGRRRLFTQDGGHKRGRTDPTMEAPDPAMEAPDRPSKEGNKHRSTLAIGEGKRGAGWEATFTCVCSRRSPRVLGTPIGATRAAAPPRWGKASLGRRAAALASHPRPEPRELESRARSPAPAAAAALGQPRLGAAPPPRERGGRGRRCTRELGLGWRQYILAEAPARFWADRQNGTRTTDHESDWTNFFCYCGHAGLASWPQRM